MRRETRLTLALALAFGAAGAVAQDGSLVGVTMRVVDDVSDIDAVVLELDAGRAEDAGDAGDAEGAEAGDRNDVADDDERSGDAARDEPTESSRDQRGEPDQPQDAVDDERSKDRLEDRDVERPAPPQPPTP